MTVPDKTPAIRPATPTPLGLNRCVADAQTEVCRRGDTERLAAEADAMNALTSMHHAQAMDRGMEFIHAALQRDRNIDPAFKRAIDSAPGDLRRRVDAINRDLSQRPQTWRK